MFGHENDRIHARRITVAAPRILIKQLLTHLILLESLLTRNPGKPHLIPHDRDQMAEIKLFNTSLI